MSNGLLEGKCGIVFGALNSDSIAWKAAEAIHAQGGKVVLTNAPIAMRMGELNNLSEAIDAPIIPADATSLDDLNALIDGAMEHFGGKIDFILHSIGMSVNVRKGKHYTELNYDWLQKGWDVSAVSFHKVMQCAWNKDAMNEWGSILGLTYMAAQRTFPITMIWLITRATSKVSHAALVTIGELKTTSALIQFLKVLHQLQQDRVLKDLMASSRTQRRCHH